MLGFNIDTVYYNAKYLSVLYILLWCCAFMFMKTYKKLQKPSNASNV